MPRPRVLSFMTAWSSPNSDPGPNSPTRSGRSQQDQQQTPPRRPLPSIDTATPQSGVQIDSLAKGSPVPSSPGTPSRARADSRATGGRPESMVQTYQPPQVDVAQDTPPELAPIFSYLNSHSNKLYQEGYFLKLHDLDSRGRPSGEREWVECFAQLVGTVLSLWDAAALDAAGEDGEVVPTFINLSDASLKMIESLPMSGAQGGSLQNVLSISTAANNRYLLHFNSYNSLTQWTAGIRLAMFEHATLQEAYTGSLIAGKGRFLNNIKQIMERSRFAHEDWARVRFGAGTPWKRCWCVVSPPDEKEYQKSQKSLKKSAYDRTVKIPKGDIKFYDTRKVTKKTRPIATITDAYAAYAIYPQSKPLIDQSTLVKLEGLVTVHTQSEATTEGFVFVMPEVHAAVSGFEMMLRWLFPVYDTFGLYGRPQRLIADTLDQRGLMFALPQDRRYGYLDILDVSGLIHAPGSHSWSERQWRKEMKKLTSERMSTYRENGLGSLRQLSQRRNTVSRTSLPGGQGGVRFDDGSDNSAPPSRTMSPLPRNPDFAPPRRTDSAPPVNSPFNGHKRAASDAHGYRKYMTETPSRLSYESGRPSDDDLPPPPPRHGGALGAASGRPGGPGGLERIQSEAEVPTVSGMYSDLSVQDQPMPSHLLPVASPPAFQHNPGSRPANQPAVPPELRRAHSNVDAATLHQMQDATRGNHTPEDEYADGHNDNRVVLTNLPNTEQETKADRTLQGVVSHDETTTQPGEPKQPNEAISSDTNPETEGGEVRKAGLGDVGPADIIIVDGHSSSRPRGDVQQQSQHSSTPPIQMQSTHSIARKLVPSASHPDPPSEASPPSDEPYIATSLSDDESRHNSLQDAFIDQDALDRVLQDGERSSTMQSAASTEPDYASSVGSIHEERRPVDRPRAGKLKTVGNPDLPQDDPKYGRLDTWQAQQAAQNAKLPNIDFGPTYAYKPSSRPGTSGTMMADERSRSRSQDRLRASGRLTPSGISPQETNNRHSYFGGVPVLHSGGASPNNNHEGDISRSHSRGQSVAWTPSSGNSPRRQQSTSLTPEQWVQQRASMAAAPHHPPRGASPAFAHHQRTGSSGSFNAPNIRKSLSKTPPPFARAHSGDWTQYAQQGQNQQGQQGQRTPPSRPLSRGASMYLSTAVAQQSNLLQSSQPASLSAREQMHVARATGTPLLDMAGKTKKQQEQAGAASAGLVGAIGARERDKAAMKAGHRSSMAVESAIRAKQDRIRQEAEAQAWHLQQQQMQQQQQQIQAQQMQMYQQQQMQQQIQQQQVANCYGGMPSTSPGTLYGFPQQQQYMPQQQQQGGAAQTPGTPGGTNNNRQSWFGGSYFGGGTQQGGR